MKIAALFAITALFPSLVAQQEAAKGAPFVLEAGEVKLTDFVDRCASYLQWNVLSNATEMANCGMSEVRTQNRLEVDRDGCIDLLSSMLTRGGCALTVLDEPKHLYEIISFTGPRGREIMNRAVRRSPGEILARPTLRMPVTTVIELKHTNATIATNALRPFYANGGSMLTIGTMGNNTAMLVSGLQDQVATAIRMVQDGDVPPPPEAVADADRVAALERRVAALEKKLQSAEKSEER